MDIRSINPAGRADFRPGAVVSLRVLESHSGGRFTLLWNSGRISAVSRLKLNIGEVIRARVEGKPGALRLRLLPSGSAPLRAAEAERRTALFSRVRGRRHALVRLYAELLTRGAEPGADFLETVHARLFGPFEDSKKSQPPSWIGVPSGDTLAEEFAPEEGDDPLLELIGSVEGASGSWRFKRLRRRMGGRETDLILKIRRGSPPALALTVHDGERTFEFLLEGRGEMRLMVFSDDPDSVNVEEWGKFRNHLASMSVHVDDAILSIEQSDGFTAGDGGARR